MVYESKIVRKRINQRVGGIVVSIAAFQAVDPGSIPGRRSVVFALFFVLHYVYYYLLERSPLLEEIERESEITEK